MSLTKKFLVTMTINTTAINPVYFDAVLNYGGNVAGSAVLKNFQYTGGATITQDSLRNASGHFTGAIQMATQHPNSVSQVLGTIGTGLQSVSFELDLTAQAGKPGWFTLSLVSNDGYLPTTLAGHPILFGAVQWSADATPVFIASGTVLGSGAGGVPDTGFATTITAKAG